MHLIVSMVMTSTRDERSSGEDGATQTSSSHVELSVVSWPSRHSQPSTSNRNRLSRTTPHLLEGERALIFLLSRIKRSKGPRVNMPDLGISAILAITSPHFFNLALRLGVAARMRIVWAYS